MARSSAAVARASDSRCAATWPLAVARRLRRAGGSGPLLAASENWLTALASARCSSAACRSMPAGSRARNALPSATRRVSTAARRASSSGASAAPAVSAAGHQPCTLLSSSCALAISLSAIASGLILNVPSAMAWLMRATLSASNSAEVAAGEQGRGGARERDRRAGVDRRRCRPWPCGSGLGGVGWPQARSLRRRVPAAACQRDVRSSWGSPRGAGAGRCRHHGRTIGPAGDDFRAFWHPARPGRAVHSGQLDPALARRQAGDDVAALGAHLAPAGLRCRW